MKIRAIRLKEVGRFSEGVALEGLSGALDVLSGPNELGKSTILEAVKLALFEKHGSTKQGIEALRPYAGGAPLIEVDFETGGDAWRIRKQFLASRSAELRNLRSDKIARGGDAETELAKLLAGADGTDRFALLWVDQGAALGDLNPAREAGGALHAVIEDEVESVSDGGAARFIAQELKAELGELMTAHASQRPAGRYKEALDEQKSLEGRRALAQKRLEAAQARLDGLESVRSEIARLRDPGAASARAMAASEAKRLFEEARAAHEKMRAAAEALARNEELFAVRRAALEALQGQLADLAKHEDTAAREAPLLAALTARVEAQAATTDAARKTRDAIKSALAAAARETKAHELAARLREMSERLAAARAAAGERKGLMEAIAANGAEDGLLAAARREAQGVATLSARLAAAAPQVAIAYARGAAGKISIGGRALQDGETITPTRSIALEIEGIGVITVAPGRSEGAEDGAADLSAHEAELAALLRKMGAATLEHAEHQATERRGLKEKLAEGAARLKALAPEGLERLEAQHADLDARANLAGPPPSRTEAELGLSMRELEGARVDAEAELAAAVSACDALVLEQGRLRTLAAERAASIKTLAASLGDAAARNARLKQLTGTLREAETARNAAAHALTLLRNAAPDEARLTALEHAAESAEAARLTAERKLGDLQRTEAGIEGELKADRAEDVAASVAELDEACGVAAARIKALSEEVGALRMLTAELERAAGETRARFAKPVLDRLMPYLQLVFPEAQPQLGTGFALEALQRAGRLERLQRLSEGTREQLAVLVRLGFGRLLAEAGNAAPLILDDALVYSDDARIERMFAALKLASRSHQVLVLTCRERAFQGLGGNRVAIAPWH